MLNMCFFPYVSVEAYLCLEEKVPTFNSSPHVSSGFLAAPEA